MQAQSKAQKEKFPVAYYLLVAVQTFMALSFYMTAPIITKYLSEIGIAIATAGLISGMMSYVCLVIRPFSGAMADRMSQRAILIISMFLFGVSNTGYGFVSSIGGFAVLRVISGITFCLSGTTIFAFAGQFIPDSRMGEGIGYLGLGNIIASAMGPVVSTTLADAFGYRVTFLAAGAFTLGCVILLAIIPKSKKEEKKLEEGPVRKTKRLRFSDVLAVELFSIAFLGSLFSYTNSTMSNFMLLFAESRGIVKASLYFTTLSIFLFVLRPLCGKITDRYGLSRVLIPGFIMTMLGVFMIMSSRSLWMLVIASAFMAFGQGGGQPAVQTECLRRMGPEKRGVATGTYYMFNDIAQGLAPTLGGALIAKGSYEAAFSACIVLFAAGLIYYVWLINHNKKKQA